MRYSQPGDQEDCDTFLQ